MTPGSSAEEKTELDAGLFNDASTRLSPPAASMERIKVRDETGRTMFDVYEPRFYGEASGTPRRTRRSGRRGLLQDLRDRLDERPVAFVASAFLAALVLSAAVTALVGSCR